MNHRIRRRLLAPLAATAAVALIATGCSSSPDDAAPEPSDSAAAGATRAGGSVTLAIDTDPGCIDPAQSSYTVALSLGAQYIDTLVDQDFDSGEIVSALAESWQVSDDATEFTFDLRPGVTFSDGTVLDAQAVKTSFDAIVALGAKASLASSYLADYVETTVDDEDTVTVRFSAANVPFLQAAATVSLGIFSPATSALSAEERCQGDLVGSGPYVLEQYDEGSQVVLRKREGYDWAPATALHTGEAYLDEIVLPLVTETSVRSGGLQSGEFDGIFQVAVQDQDPLEQAGYTLVGRANPGNAQSLFANALRPIVSEKTVRQAVLKGIDREEFRDTLLGERYAVPTSVLSPTTPGFVDLAEELAYDPEGAASLLDDAGWTLGADGVRERDGVRLSLKILTSSWAQAQAELAQSQLLRIGIETQIESPETTLYNSIRAEGDWDYAFSGLTRADPDTLRRDYWSGSWPNSAARVPENPIDELLLEQKAEPDPTVRDEIVAEAQRAIVDEAFGVPYATNLQIYAVSTELQDLRLDASSRLRLYDAWLQ